MSVWQAIVLGLVQGLTEFLPVSSSAHLALAPWLLGWRDPGLAFDVALHLGTLVAVAWYFRHDWLELTKAALRIARSRRVQSTADRRLLLLIAATIPAGVGGVLLKDYAETVFRHPAITASMLILLGLILWAVDRAVGTTRSLDDLTARDAWLIGLAQVCALVPGVSRSGSTMTAARALGFERGAAARFSFLMSLPIISAAVLFKLPDVLRDAGALGPLLAGITAAAVSSWLAITVLLRFVSRNSFGVFAVYRVALGIVVLVLLATRGAPTG
ncbi:MAG TPA: undecaprenyl-diphosphatase UppP [Gemmatimonadaceae bacterium]|nr:undecaprenyl-diphosphatase UppP [Gemmatimonadaceae bacterium]